MNILIMAFLLSSCSSKFKVFTISGKTMGTTYQVKISSLKKINTQSVKEQIDKTLQLLNQQMSTYIENSEISLLNKNYTTNQIKLSPALFSMIELSQKISYQSDRYFDITVAPLVNLWGFGPKKIKDGIPSQDEIQSVMRFIGPDKYQLDPESQMIQKKHKMVSVDLSAIAKGHGVDLVSKLLNQLGFNQHLVEIGGELRATKRKTPQLSWKIAIEDPLKKKNTFILSLNDISIATSGNYKQFVQRGDKFFGHTINPKTGQSTYRTVLSATVLHQDCAIADAWATAFMAMGITKAMEYSTKYGLAAYFIVKEPGKQIQKMLSPEFIKYKSENTK